VTLDTSWVFRVPVYPAFLALVTWGAKVWIPLVLAQAAVGACTVLCAAAIARELFGPLEALIAAALTAVYPYYVIHDTAIQETGLFTFLTAWSILLLIRTRRSGTGRLAIQAGLLMGVDVLTRPTIVPFLVVPALWLAIYGAGGYARRVRVAILFSLSVSIVIAPWLIRSYVRVGSPILTSEGGAQLLAGNNPQTFSHYPTESIDFSVGAFFDALTPRERDEIESSGANEAVQDSLLRQRAVAYMRTYPWRTVRAAFVKLWATFGILPSPRKGGLGNLAHVLSYGPVALLALVGILLTRQAWREHLIVYGLILSFAAVVAVFFGHSSHRSFLDVYLIGFASVVLGRMLTKWVEWRKNFTLLIP
jgi:4-amino-4-deoxy-L-arabinose transferase-like glycosyltransferase